MATAREMMISWLNDAHSMETSLVQVLEHQVRDTQDYPQVQSRIQQHLEETRRHVEMVKDCVEALGGRTSAVKTGMASLLSQLHAHPVGATPDKLIKEALSDYAAENFEIACYTSLIQTAKALGEQRVANVCQQILQEEEAMANWLGQNIPALTEQTLRQVAG